MHLNVGRFQVIWWGFLSWRSPRAVRWPGSLAHIYDWSAYLGPIEVRRWARRSSSEGSNK
jgi:hypothetical protein